MATERTRRAIYISVGVAVAAFVFSGLTALFHRGPITPEQAATAMAADPAVGRFLAVLKETFPDDYRGIMVTSAADVNSGMSTEQAHAAGFGMSQSLVARHKADIARAPDDALITLQRAQATLLGHLPEPMCAHIFMQGLQPGDTVADGVKADMVDVSSANLRAARAGIDHPTTRPAQLLPVDADALHEQLRRKGLTSAQIDIFGHGTLASANATDQCAIGRALYGAIVAMPPAQAGRVSHVMLAAS